MKVTYGQLDKALKSLGFRRLKSREFRAYREAEHEAIIALPPMRANTLVSDPHLVAVCNTVTGRGVATLEDLYAALMKANQAIDTSVVQQAQVFLASRVRRQHLHTDVTIDAENRRGQTIRRRILRDQRRHRLGVVGRKVQVR